MGRPIKRGLDYFPLDVKIFSDRNIIRLKRKQGAEGVMLYLHILCNIYESGYFVKADTDYIFDLSCDFNIEELQVLSMIKEIVALDLFNQELYTNHKVLTSEVIQDNYVYAKKNVAKYQLLDKKLDLISDLKGRNPKDKPTLSETKPFDSETKPAVSDLKPTVSDERSAHTIPYNTILDNTIPDNTINNCTTTTSCACAHEGENSFSINNSESNLPETRQPSTESQVTPNSYSITEILANFRKEAEADSEWKECVYRMSGYNQSVLEELPKMLPYFEDHLISIAETGSIRTINDYKRRFLGWWRCVDFMNEEQLKAKTIMRKNSKQGRRRLDTNEDFEMMAARTAKLALEITKRGGDLC